MKENSNGNDTNVGSIENSIEEDIKLLQDETSSLVLFFKCKGSEKYKIALEHILSDYKRVLKENEELKEYIATAPNSDEMTATKYRNIQQDAYIQGRAEEQKKAEQIIYENYIPVQKVKDKIKEKEQEINNINSQLNTYKIRQIEYDKREKNLKNEINENVKRKINILKDNICNKIKNTKGNLSKDKVIDIVYKEAE